jgi:hypothetical protein
MSQFPDFRPSAFQSFGFSTFGDIWQFWQSLIRVIRVHPWQGFGVSAALTIIRA